LSNGSAADQDAIGKEPARAAAALRITSGPTPAGSPMLIANRGGVFRLSGVII
jgi:hypothetical protein